MNQDPDLLYRPPAPVPTTPVRALARAIFSPKRDMLSLMPRQAFQEMIMPVGWTRRKIVLVNDPQIIKRIMTAEAGLYPKNDLMVGALEPLVGQSVFVSSGKDWQRQRRIIDPAFAHMRVTHAFDAMQAGINAYWEQLDTYVATGESFSLEKAMSHLTADIICRTIFSQSLNSGASREVFDCFAEFQNSVANIQVMRLWLGRPWASIKQPRATRKVAGRVRRLLGDILDERLAAPAGRYSDIAGDIVLSRDTEDGSRFDREELIDHLGVFFLAGHETTAGALAWCLFILSQQPDLMDRLREEVGPDGEMSIEAVKKFSLTRSVFRETLRLYPPLAFIPRVAVAPANIGGVDLPRGAMVMISPWVLHRHENLWPAADRFDPERFLTPNHQEGAYLPFGLGPRVCVGAAFALIEAVLILARFVARYDVEATDPARVQPAARLTTRSLDDITVRIRRR